ncbi:MAG: DNA-directed DNA polymerase II small subunit [Candidatus Woesearchaeota archaeon]|nr:DNA-directed DNA polymerase II small subunit [Candidatus Woesearchaeota archaeon]
MKAEQEFKKEIVNFFLKKGILLSKDFYNIVKDNFDRERFLDCVFDRLKENQLLILDTDLLTLINENMTNEIDINCIELERFKALKEKGKIEKERKILFQQFEKEKNIKKEEGRVNILFSYEDKFEKKGAQDFISIFNRRYETIKKMLLNRQELQHATSISRIFSGGGRESCAFIGCVFDKAVTANNNYILSLEDQSGEIKAIVSKNKPAAYELAKEITLDEVVGITGTLGNNAVFVNNILIPDIPLHKELKKSPDKAYAVFLSDLHIGSNKFLPEEFNKFLDWINGRTGTEAQKEIASKVKYIFIIGDLVDGVGVYPEQEAELEIKDIYEQYDECARLLKKIPPHIKIIICAGNHDALRISEPQPKLDRDYAKTLWEMKNVILVSNPALVNIHSSENFSGFDILMYHGYSFDYYISSIDTIREKGGYDRPDLIMKYLLQRRHLAPTHTSTLYVPDPERDPLVIEKIPDFFATGHIHKSAVANYHNITMICGSCWQSRTTFQERVGHHPEPARVPVVDLQTRNVKILRFDK